MVPECQCSSSLNGVVPHVTCHIFPSVLDCICCLIQCKCCRNSFNYLSCSLKFFFHFILLRNNKVCTWSIFFRYFSYLWFSGYWTQITGNTVVPRIDEEYVSALIGFLNSCEHCILLGFFFLYTHTQNSFHFWTKNF